MDDGGLGDGGGHGYGQVEKMRTVEVMKMGMMVAEEGIGLEKTGGHGGGGGAGMEEVVEAEMIRVEESMGRRR